MRDPAGNDPDVEAAIERAREILSDGMAGWDRSARQVRTRRPGWISLPLPGGRPENRVRDGWIASTVGLICKEFGLSPTRNRAKHGKQGDESGCAVVALALTRLRVTVVDEGAVEKVWQRRQKIFEPRHSG
jgi:hypothetical protein